ncbi:MAG: hypothetical protein Q4D62_05265 [Planctomycetia bacterium]|nr:hypothetical protein [Planctomycetia bacterium]
MGLLSSVAAICLPPLLDFCKSFVDFYGEIILFKSKEKQIYNEIVRSFGSEIHTYSVPEIAFVFG